MPDEVSKLVGYAAVNFPDAKAGASKVVGYAALNFPDAKAGASKVVGYAAMYAPIFVGQTLAYAGDTWTYSPTSFAVQWRRDGVPIVGATGPSYLLAVADVGALITVALIASNASGSGEAVISADVGPVRVTP